PQLKNKKCIINVKNNDNLCILYAISTYLYLKDYYKNIIKKIKENYEFPIKSEDIFKEIIKPYSKRIKISDDLSFPMDYIEFKEVIKEYISPEKLERVTKYKNIINKFNVKGLEFPLEVNKIKKLINLNKDLLGKITFYVFEYNNIDNNNISIPIAINNDVNNKDEIYLLLYSHFENNKLINSHYCYIKNLSRFVNVKNKIKGIKKI